MSQKCMFWRAFEIQKRSEKERFPTNQLKTPKTSVEKEMGEGHELIIHERRNTNNWEAYEKVVSSLIIKENAN